MLRTKDSRPLFPLIPTLLICAALCGAALAQDRPSEPDKKNADERVVDLGGVMVYPDRHTFIFPGRVVLREGVLELFVCARDTKEHESIVATETPGRLLHAAALMLGATPGRAVQYQGDPAPPAGTRVTFEMVYEKDGAETRVPAHTLIANEKTGEPMSDAGWVFVGSETVATDRGAEYLAEITGAYIVTYNDPSAIFDNPSAFGADDTVYVAHTERIPPIGTHVTVVGTVHRDERE